MTKPRAVVVEDNAATRELVATTLKAKGYDAFEAETAEQGWKLIQKTGPRVMVIDIMLPGQMDGLELARTVRAQPRFKDAAIVMITGADSRKMARLAIESGADVLIPKPFLPKEFVRQVEEILARRARTADRPTVLILDDDPNDIAMVEGALEPEGFKVVSLDNSRAALQIIRNECPQIVLLDVIMPDVSGQDIAEFIAADKMRQKPKIILYSNLSGAELKKICEQTRAHGYVCKSDGPRALVQALRRALAAA